MWVARVLKRLADMDNAPCGSRITNTAVLMDQRYLCNFHGMSLLLQLLAQFLRCLALLCRKDGLKEFVAQNLLLTQQLIVLNRGRKRAPSISPLHRIWLAFFLMFLSARRLQQTAVVFRPSTFLRFKEFRCFRHQVWKPHAELGRSPIPIAVE